MIGRRIELFEKFSLWTEVVMFYGDAHSSYLLLTKLSKKSREMLDNNYDGIINSLLENKAFIDIKKENTTQFDLPWDLFNFTIDIEDEEMLHSVLTYITDTIEQKGYFFNQHFMSKRLCLSCFYLPAKLVDKIYKYIEILKTIEVIESIYYKDFDVKFNKTYLLNSISLKDISDFIVDKKHFVLPKWGESESLDKWIDEVFRSFVKIFNLYLAFYTWEEASSILKCIKDLGMCVDFVTLVGRSWEEAELQTNSEYYLNGLVNFTYKFKELHILSDDFFKNINQMQPKSLTFSFDYNLNGSFDIIQSLK